MDRGSQTRLPTRPAVCCAASRTLRASVMTALQVGPGRQPAIWPGPRGLGFMRPGGRRGGAGRNRQLFSWPVNSLPMTSRHSEGDAVLRLSSGLKSFQETKAKASP